MSLMNEYRATEDAIKELQAKLDALSNNERLLEEMEFEEKLRSLMYQYGKSLRDIILILDPAASKKVDTAPIQRRKARIVKVYRNPESGEVVQTKGGNHRQLKAWKQEYGDETVEGWLER
ncbi:histone-like nucleoid-structuring protein, MvaT/MvaU family [Pseudomonas sp. H11T01]|uniref:histone-like nucleoid-structuring protein, MvaT/MvaU family n=1 Tax=Pseudomonas sp. H11T01 TaxID=3402749 RepID=UPI003AC1C1AB